ncbi:kinase domain protein (macronuclear) [Tetrahymena thermophila SB210]|uniref:Kinase domain protein n=1 Tax=Tetrahymena thermophila (strain SB210) TaxID=312017 RepID=W7XHH2_TETTS|nr:kinase domain protein [Tetrahymena thermophila SB210]EWS72554.1 kinase domain protein [Tetrahymena thermophila SB210]|eukprot:XP_012654837.1 kinase domain protein [Tetrahymena thermophila SB210]
MQITKFFRGFKQLSFRIQPDQFKYESKYNFYNYTFIFQINPSHSFIHSLICLLQIYKEQVLNLNLNYTIQKQMIQEENHFDTLEDLLNSSKILVSELDIDLINNFIGDAGVSSLCSILITCKNLSNLTLNLYDNSISDQGASNLCFSLVNCKNLSTLKLHLDYNLITDEGTQNIGSALSNCYNLSILELYLKSNQIGDKGVSDLGFTLQNCKNLIILTLYLESNFIRDQGITNLSSALTKYKKLQFLTMYLEWNKISEVYKQKFRSKLLIINRLVNLQIFI